MNGKLNDWFDEEGYLTRDIPDECIQDCVGEGRNADTIFSWVDELDFGVPRDKAIEYAKSYGAWTRRELNEFDDRELAAICLWIGANEFKDNGQWFGLV